MCARTTGSESPKVGSMRRESSGCRHTSSSRSSSTVSSRSALRLVSWAAREAASLLSSGASGQKR